MNVKIVPVVLMLAAVGAILVNSYVSYPWEIIPAGNSSGQDLLKKFNSPGEIKSFLEKNTAKRGYGGYGILEKSGRMAVTDLAVPMAAAPATSTPMLAAGGEGGSEAPVPSYNPPSTDGASDFSTTNIQVEGVDEADIVKSDGKYIYVLSGRTVSVVDAYPPEGAKILSTITIKGDPSALYINGDRLVVVGNDYVYEYPDVQERDGATSEGIAEMVMPYPGRVGHQKAGVYVYDISDRRAPELSREVFVDGAYFNSRMIGDYVYVIASKNAYYNDVVIPQITDSTDMWTIGKTPDVYYFDGLDDQYSFTTVISVDTRNEDAKVGGKIYLLGAAQNMFVSKNNIYITYQGRSSKPYSSNRDKTIIHMITIGGGEIEYMASGEVPGRVLNQFSMDEYDNYLRIATTGRVSGGAQRFANHIYVLDEDLKIVGELENLAPGEKIYSARFMGKRAYLVTFKKVDPLFVVDLSDPRNPNVLGKLKIPGYSDYLHPYDENHIIGLGKDTVEAGNGNFAWYQGIKLALFDVSDVERPREVSKFVIGDRGTDSYALRDHRAFLFSREKNLLVIPVLLAKIDADRYYGEIPKNAHGEYVWQGAYVFNIDARSGITLRGKTSHSQQSDSFSRSFYRNSKYSIKRSLYMDDTLYTVSDGMIKMNDLDYLYEINRLPLQVKEEPVYGYMPEGP